MYLFCAKKEALELLPPIKEKAEYICPPALGIQSFSPYNQSDVAPCTSITALRRLFAVCTLCLTQRKTVIWNDGFQSPLPFFTSCLKAPLDNWETFPTNLLRVYKAQVSLIRCLKIFTVFSLVLDNSEAKVPSTKMVPFQCRKTCSPGTYIIKFSDSLICGPLMHALSCSHPVHRPEIVITSQIWTEWLSKFYILQT